MTTRKPLSSIEIQSNEFRRVFRGFDPEEVRMFLQAVAESHQALILEKGQLAQSVEHLQAALDEFRRRENVLKDALYTAQRTAEEVKTQAMREAQSIVQEAQVRGEAYVQQAQLRAHQLERSIIDLRMERENALSALRELLQRTQNLLEVLEPKAEGEVKTFFKEKDV
jgi:cell division initiation protein